MEYSRGLMSVANSSNIPTSSEFRGAKASSLVVPDKSERQSNLVRSVNQLNQGFPSTVIRKPLYGIAGSMSE
jgi:hypothetical protein